MFKLSPSALNLYKECKRCFYRDKVQHIKRPSGIFPSLPSGMDRILKEHFDRHRKSNTIPKEIQSLKLNLFQDEELLKIYRNQFKGIRYEDKKGNILLGAVDDLLQKNKEITVIDFKTRGFPLKEDTAKTYQDQVNIYAFLLGKNKHKVSNKAYLLFFYPDKMLDNGDITFHHELVQMTVHPRQGEQLFKDAIALLEGEEPAPSEDCGFCQWH